MPEQLILATQALTAQGWREDVEVAIGEDGRIASVRADGLGGDAGGDAGRGKEPPTDRLPHHRVDVLLPAPTNLHSHAFQRAMAGLAERRGPASRDSFWTWRDLMFRFLDQLSPEDVESIAAFAQMEMLEAGFAAVAEFHYLHHDRGGRAYPDPAETSARILAAAEASGIGLSLLPSLYRHGGCDRRPLAPGQDRFGTTLEGFAELHRAAAGHLRRLPRDARIGIAPHSLRAVGPDELVAILPLADGGPVHIHAAEQRAEVEEVLAALGARPVEWLLDNAPVGPGWCIIHATQTSEAERAALARSGAVVGLCPGTEASLGDGIFQAVHFAGQGGRYGVGSDSNVRIALGEELRLLEYGQRLRDGVRAALAQPPASTGRSLFQAALQGGAQAAGRRSGAIEVGMEADLLALRTAGSDLEGLRGDTLLDGWIFGSAPGAVGEVWAAGRHLVKEGAHLAREAIARRYRATVAGLRSAL